MSQFADSVRIAQTSVSTNSTDGLPGGQPTQLNPTPDANAVATMVSGQLAITDFTPYVSPLFNKVTASSYATQVGVGTAAAPYQVPGVILDKDGLRGYSSDSTDPVFNINSSGNVTAVRGTIGGFTLGPTTLTAGTGTSMLGLDTDFGIYAGGPKTSAPFSVTLDGTLNATKANISGSISGSVITGSRFKTAASGGRIEIYDNGGIFGNLLFYTGVGGEVAGSIITTTYGSGTTQQALLAFATPYLTGSSASTTLNMYSSGPSGNGGSLEINTPDHIFFSTNNAAGYISFTNQGVTTASTSSMSINGYQVMRVSESNKSFVQGGSFNTSFSASSSDSGTFVYTTAGQHTFSVAPIIVFTAQDSHSFDLVVSLTAAPTTTGFAWRTAVRNGSNVTGTSTINYMAFGQ